MQHDSSRINWNGQGGSYAIMYPMINQMQTGTGTFYPRTYQPILPPASSYVSFPPPLIAGPGCVPLNVVPPTQIVINDSVSPNTSHQSQQNPVVIPDQAQSTTNQTLAIMTTNLKVFFIISGLLYLLWCLALLGLEIYITIETYWTFYRNIWTTGFIIAGGICMLTNSCQTFCAMSTIIRALSLALFFSLLGIILSTVNYLMEAKCYYRYQRYTYFCESNLIDILKLSNIGIYVLITIHIILNMLVCGCAHKEISSETTTSNMTDQQIH